MTAPKFSIIICSIDAGRYARICESYRSLMGDFAFEIIGIHDAKSLAEAYNRGMCQSSGDILIFSHDDILILDREFPRKMVDRLQQFDVLGFVGTTRLINATWFGAGYPHLCGLVSHARPKEAHLSIDLFGTPDWPVVGKVKAIDGLCMITRREVAEAVGFDETTFDGFHLYDIDFSFCAHLAGHKIGICCDIPIIHESTGQFDAKHAVYARRFIEKHHAHLDTPTPDDLAQGNRQRPTGRAAKFKDLEEVRRAWTPALLQRATVALRHTYEPPPGA